MEGVLCRPITGFYSGNDSIGMAKSIGIFSNNDYLQYYRSNYRSRSRHPKGIRCSVVTEEDVKKNKKMIKKQKKMMKLLKGLPGDLAMSFGGLDSLDSSYNQEWKDASEVLLSQLKKVKAEQKQTKKMIKEKAKTREAICGSSSSSSSESSDSECERKVLDISRLKHETNKEKNIGISEQDSSNILLSLLGKEKEAAKEKKKIEVCMGGKCKRSGAEALLEEFQKVAGEGNADVDIVGCKCMGKCRDGPNVRLVSPPAIDGIDHDDELVHHNHRHVVVTAGGGGTVEPRSVITRRVQRPSYPLCIGVGLDDVSLIVSKFVGEY